MKAHISRCTECRAAIDEYHSAAKAVGILAAADVVPTLGDDFAYDILKAVTDGVQTPNLSNQPITRFRLRKLFLSAAAAVLFLAMVVIYGLNQHIHHRRITKQMEQIENAAQKSEPTILVDQSLLANPMLEGPFNLSSWESSGTGGIMAVLHKPDPLNKPETYVIDYIGEFNDTNGTDFLWSRLEREQLLARAGDDDNVYIVFYPMTESRKRTLIASAVKKKFRPYFKNGV